MPASLPGVGRHRPVRLDAGSKKVESKMTKAMEEDAQEADAILENILFTTDYGKLSDADLVIEAAFESADVKNKIFARETTCPKTMVLASNSSHMTPEEIFATSKDKSRCLVLPFLPGREKHFARSHSCQETNPALVDFFKKLYEFIGKAPIIVKSRFGFATIPFFEGVFCRNSVVEKGLATVKQTMPSSRRPWEWVSVLSRATTSPAGIRSRSMVSRSTRLSSVPGGAHRSSSTTW
jgi:hypothetical protein